MVGSLGSSIPWGGSDTPALFTAVDVSKSAGAESPTAPELGILLDGDLSLKSLEPGKRTASRVINKLGDNKKTCP